MKKICIVWPKFCRCNKMEHCGVNVGGLELVRIRVKKITGLFLYFMSTGITIPNKSFFKCAGLFTFDRREVFLYLV